MSNSRLEGAWAVVCPPPPTRAELRERVMQHMELCLPRSIDQGWQGWPGTTALADAALTALGYQKDGT